MNAAFRTIVRSPEIAKSDLLLITGDVTDRGDPAAWSVFREAVTEARVDDRVLVVPGNHDVCCLGLARLPRRGAQTDGAEFETFPWIVRPIGELGIFGLNSNNLGNLTLATNARGDVDYYQLERLSRLLWKYREVPVKIIALHHSPRAVTRHWVVRLLRSGTHKASPSAPARLSNAF